MSSHDTFQPPLTARGGGAVAVLGVVRISTDNQSERSLEDQEALYRRLLDQRAGRPYRLTMIASRGSGEHLDRAEYVAAWDAIEAETYDLVICEDLARIARRTHVVQFVELCEDRGVRVMAINDQVDTAREDWRLLAGFASLRHEMYNADTARRIRRSLRNRFSAGGIVQTFPYGYIKPPKATKDEEVRKDPDAQPVYDRIVAMLEGGASFCEVADWLNEAGVKPGPYVRQAAWDGRMLARLIFNPIIKGVRVRNERMSKRVNSTGRRKSVKAPSSERLERSCPHLAFVEPDRYDRLIAKLRERGDKYKRSAGAGIDVRANVPRKRTPFPGQHAVCGVCGRLVYWGAHGQTTHMACAGVRDYRCWNTCGFDGALARERIAAATFERIAALPEFDEVLRSQIEAEAAVFFRDADKDESRLAALAAETTRKLERLHEHMLRSPSSASLASKLEELEGRQREIGAELAEVRGRCKEVPRLPSMQELRQRIDQSFSNLAATDPEFGRVMRTLLPVIAVFPFRLIDGGPVVARARVTLDLTGLVSRSLAEAAVPLLRQAFWVDLFRPPQHVALRERIVAGKEEGMTDRQVAAQVGVKQAVVSRSVALDRKLRQAGLADPYVLLRTPPDDSAKYRLHRHDRYRFEPLAGFPAWPDDLPG